MMLIGGAHVLLPPMKFSISFSWKGVVFFPLLGHLKALCEGRVESTLDSCDTEEEKNIIEYQPRIKNLSPEISKSQSSVHKE